MTTAQLHRARRLLCALQDDIRDKLIAARDRDARRFAEIAAVTAADTIYHVDKLSEEAIFAWFEKNWPRAWPVELVMEGIEDGDLVTFPRGTPAAKTVFKCILDPIDGTRNLMYDKRSAWILAALAPQKGPRTNLRDIVIAAMTELPTSKHWASDQISVVRGGGPRGVVGERFDLRTRKRRRLALRPSQANDFKHGFASLAKFFPEGKSLTAKIEEELWDELHGLGSSSSPLVFDDQYITTGGQIYELLVGHDRMIGDLRPLVLAKLGFATALVCHPYDICTALILEEAGGVVEAPDGRPLSALLDTTSPIAWMGYANPVLAKQVRPILRRLLRKHAG
ncbi:MAG TPA: inositol monophosphatase [Opitutaceae bacterium]|nr:inositol monophosphatase [Opitutaceae bacterium]